MDESFEHQLSSSLPMLTRFVRFRLPSGADWEDVMQEVCISAYENRASLRNPEAFRPWLLSIARRRCADWYRQRMRYLEVPLDEALSLPGGAPLGTDGHPSLVEEVLDDLSAQDRQVLTMAYAQQLSQQEIARRLHIPLGTVKSRLHAARLRFRQVWLNTPSTFTSKGGNIMEHTPAHRLPAIMPDYTITPLPDAPFTVRWEELDGWLLVPRLGESCSWAMYDDPERRRTWQYDMRVLGEAEVHGLRGVEIEAISHGQDPTAASSPSDLDMTHFVAQLTDTHCRFLACTATQQGVKRLFTFLDGDAFLDNWGFGKDNCGKEIYPRPQGLILRDGSALTCRADGEIMDVTGRFRVTLGSTVYDTICIVELSNNQAMLSEQYIDPNGRTVLWRRFNRDTWALERYGARWSERLPRSEQLTLNGETFVHWYDCLTDYVCR